MSRAQQIRPSQFITTYGPGSILEGPDGPRIIPSLELSGVFGNEPPRTYAIAEPTLSRLLDGNVVRIPSNAERNVIDTEYIYNTLPFPGWSLCVTHNVLYRYGYNGELRTGCPQCKPHGHPSQATLHARREAIRVVVACRDGHVDDLPWTDTVQHRGQCAAQWLRWERIGSSLEQVRLHCPVCEATGTLGGAYYRDWHCSGRLPERKSREVCRQVARVINRAASNVHMTELMTTLTIPRLDTSLHQALASSAVLPMLRSWQSLNLPAAIMREQLIRLSVDGALPRGLSAEVAPYSAEVVGRTVEEVLGTQFVENEKDVRRNELRELHRAALHGHPTCSNPGDPPTQLQVIRDDVRIVPGPGGHALRVAPVSRLRVVMAQRGYRRLGGPDTKLVDVAFAEGGDRWYPGIELLGEGVFLELAGDDAEAMSPHFPFTGPDADIWLTLWQAEQIDELHPVYVWWHTLAHRLLNALAVDSGYASASIRERIFFDAPNRGGILLYTVQPGGDGTLGGMIALVPRFESILQAALASIGMCSNDPLCGETQMARGLMHGAICYACGMVSETSCEVHNRSLDRRLLMENLP